jgi:murein L,D-transpeptidase YafK
MKFEILRSRLLAACLVAGAAGWLAGCEDSLDSGSGRSLRPIPPQTLAQMDKIGTTESAPVLIRTYKKEAEFEIWKMKSDGQYALLKTFPMCRWSGQLGPKTREGDRQVPEGFYTIAPSQMNPNSNYYLSFNVGYPNAYDKAWDRTGGNIMVHGVCSSAGCYSMTDAQIAEIYAIAREAFNGGQHEIQMQSYPFRMTAENLAKHRLDPNIDFWMQLKNGYDHFEVTKTEPAVLVCGKRYVFGAHADGDVSARAPCPALHRDDDVEQQVAAKAAEDNTKVAELVAKGVKAIRLVYQDGGQNPVFAGKDPDVSRPDALAAGPQEIVLENSGKSIPAVMKVANAASEPKPAKAEPAVDSTTVSASAAPSAAPAASPPSLVEGGKSLMKNWFKPSADTPPAVQVFEPEQPIPSNVPLPPRRAAASDSQVRMAAVKPPAPAEAGQDADAKTQ